MILRPWGTRDVRQKEAREMAKPKKRRKKKPYSERTDREKISNNWRKTLALFQKGEYSVSIIRVATTAELATNLVIRAELAQGRNLPPSFVDRLMKWANGLQGKMNMLILPIVKDDSRHKSIKKLAKIIQEVNEERNGVVHRGEFRGRKIARRTLEKVRQIVLALVTLYEPRFDLSELPDS